MKDDGDDAAGTRVDKWLWAARFYKTRALARTAVEAGKVKLHDERIKPSKILRAGDALAIRIGEYEWRVTVKALSAQRGPAAIAQLLYEESNASRAQRDAQAADRKAQGSLSGERKGRPTKRERRQIIRFRDGGS